MKPTRATLLRFVGGQLEVKNPNGKYIIRGQIKSIRLLDENDDAVLIVGAGMGGKGRRLPTPRQEVG